MTSGDRGYAMAALLVAMSVMAIMLAAALPVWSTAAQREREAELIFRGEQYAHAIELYSRRNGGYPASLDVLEKGRFIRKLYKDPVAGDTDFQPVFAGQIIAGQPVTPRQPGQGEGAAPPGRAAAAGPSGPAPGRGGLPPAQGQRGVPGGGPIIGVVSRSTSESLRLYNGRGRYNEWAFVATALSQQAGAPSGAPGPAQPGRGGRGGAQPGPQRGTGGRALPFPRGGFPFPGRLGPGAPPGNPLGTPNTPPTGGSTPQPR